MHELVDGTWYEGTRECPLVLFYTDILFSFSSDQTCEFAYNGVARIIFQKDWRGLHSK